MLVSISVTLQVRSVDPKKALRLQKQNNFVILDVRPEVEFKGKHRDLAREAVRKSLVLLNNGKSASKPLLPLPKVFNENPNLNFVKPGEFSYAIVVVGEPPYAETKGDSMNLTIPNQGQARSRMFVGRLNAW
ncbi:unnamed protein product [Amaranthus hypochondriacus]